MARSLYNESLNDNSSLNPRNSLPQEPNHQRQKSESPSKRVLRKTKDIAKLFPSLPLSDLFVEEYMCALTKDILLQGWLYVTTTTISFYSNLFGFVTKVSIPFTEVVSFEKKFTAIIIPNAILITTKSNAKYLLTSFTRRDETYNKLVGIWESLCPDMDPSPKEQEEALEIPNEAETASFISNSVDKNFGTDPFQATVRTESFEIEGDKLGGKFPTSLLIYSLAFMSLFLVLTTAALLWKILKLVQTIDLLDSKAPREDI